MARLIEHPGHPDQKVHGRRGAATGNPNLHGEAKAMVSYDDGTRLVTKEHTIEFDLENLPKGLLEYTNSPRPKDWKPGPDPDMVACYHIPGKGYLHSTEGLGHRDIAYLVGKARGVPGVNTPYAMDIDEYTLLGAIPGTTRIDVFTRSDGRASGAVEGVGLTKGRAKDIIGDMYDSGLVQGESKLRVWTNVRGTSVPRGGVTGDELFKTGAAWDDLTVFDMLESLREHGNHDQKVHGRRGSGAGGRRGGASPLDTLPDGYEYVRKPPDSGIQQQPVATFFVPGKGYVKPPAGLGPMTHSTMARGLVGKSDQPVDDVIRLGAYRVGTADDGLLQSCYIGAESPSAAVSKRIVGDVYDAGAIGFDSPVVIIDVAGELATIGPSAGMYPSERLLARDLLVESLREHLPGQHDQRSHGRRGSGGGGGGPLDHGPDNFDSKDHWGENHENSPYGGSGDTPHTTGWADPDLMAQGIPQSVPDYELARGPSDAVIQSAAAKLRAQTLADNHEHMMAFDKDGKLIGHFRGGEHSVAPPIEIATRSHTMIHSHPHSPEDTVQAPHSPSDFGAQAAFQQARGGVVTTDGYHEVAVPDGYVMSRDFGDFYAFTVMQRLGAPVRASGTPDPATMVQGLRMACDEAGFTYRFFPPGQTIMGESLREHLPGKHDQRTHGRRFSTGGTHYGAGTKDDPIVTSNVEVAAKAIEMGKFVELRSRKEVATLLEEMAANVEEARRMGRNAPNYDLCKVSVPKTNLFCVENLGIPRVQMPQLKGVPTPGSKADQLVKAGKLKYDQAGEVDLAPMFADYMASKGIRHRNVSTSPEYLKATQRELNGVTVAGISRAMEQGTFPTSAGRIITTRDSYVVDGHHRWAGQVALQVGKGVRAPIRTTEYDCTITEALPLAHAFASEMGLPTVSMTQNRYVEAGAG